MKKIVYRLYGLLYGMFRGIPLRKKKVVLYMIHNSKFQGNLAYVYEEMKRRDDSFRFVIVSKADLLGKPGLLHKIRGVLYFYFILNYHFATAEYIMLNDNFLPLAYMNIRKQTKLIQLWHGVGAFKKFGLSTEEDPFVRELVYQGNQKMSQLFVSSDKVIPYYEEAFGISRERIHATGVPITDYYFDESRIQEAKHRVYETYPEIKNKKIILYTPTFRNTEEENNEILSRFNCSNLSRQLGDDYVILVRLHPQVKPTVCNYEGCIDVTKYDDVKGLYAASTLLITDYSSTMVEYTLFKKPIIFYAYDLEKYDRGFYFDYEQNVPGYVVKDEECLLQAIKKSNEAELLEKQEKFLLAEYNYLDGHATKRVVDLLLNKE
ncbi:putative polyribitolphosphotransferase [Lachnospiraceae bacterium KM106-2]|nr:putative polyribitolphosphotransferase [Lachnospiraceae bacterium KM106-2]